MSKQGFDGSYLSQCISCLRKNGQGFDLTLPSNRRKRGEHGRSSRVTPGEAEVQTPQKYKGTHFSVSGFSPRPPRPLLADCPQLFLRNLDAQERKKQSYRELLLADASCSPLSYLVLPNYLFQSPSTPLVAYHHGRSRKRVMKRQTKLACDQCRRSKRACDAPPLELPDHDSFSNGTIVLGKRPGGFPLPARHPRSVLFC